MKKKEFSNKRRNRENNRKMHLMAKNKNKSVLYGN